MIPLVVYLIKQYFPGIQAAQVGPLIVIGAIIGVTIAAGPIIYATAIQRLFWLKNTSSMGLAHELKSPLASIEGATETLLIHNSQASSDLSKNFDYLHIIQRNTERLNLFVHDLLKIAQIQDDAVVLNKKNIDLSNVVSDVVTTFQHLADQKNVKIVMINTQDTSVEADEAKIRQVVSNLMSNALKFTPSGSITISTNKHNNYISCTVDDTGDGISAADMKRVFTRFFHGIKSAKGTGLGLAIAKAWVEAHEGKIWAETEGEGKGTKIIFTLPGRL
jgi:signal transduction histidine kinase